MLEVQQYNVNNGFVESVSIEEVKRLNEKKYVYRL